MTANTDLCPTFNGSSFNIFNQTHVLNQYVYKFTHIFIYSLTYLVPLV